VVLLDDFSNCERSVPARIVQIAHTSPVLIEGDVSNTALVHAALTQHRIDGVVHLAGLKAVAESVAEPLAYYRANINGALSVLTAMQTAGVRQFVFSSSATVYGVPQYLPIDEKHPLAPQNPYGTTKWHIEHMLQDLAQSEPGWRILLLRYFNPVGAHESGLIGENPLGAANNLMPVMVDVMQGRRAELHIFGNDYPTRDGSAVRDYIHVMDLAEGHVAAIEKLTAMAAGESTQAASWCDVINLGTGQGTTVSELVRAFERAWGQALPSRSVGRRPGDVAECYAATDKAREVLRFTARRGLELMCESQLHFSRERAKRK